MAATRQAILMLAQPLAGAAVVTADWTPNGSPPPNFQAGVNVVPSGGTGPYTYSWSITAGGAGVTVLSPGTALTELDCDSTPFTTLVCTVGDSLTSVQSNPVSVG